MIKFGNNDTKLYLGANEVTSIYLGSTQVYSGDTPTPPTPTPYDEQYLTFVAEADNMSVGLTYANANVYQYSVDSGQTWSNLANNQSTSAVNSGETIMFKASGLTPTTNDGIGTLRPSTYVKVQGNIMSLVYGDNFVGQTTISNRNQFKLLFEGATYLTDASNLIMPATTLANACYQSMFNGCTSLTSAPELPATTLSNRCYYNMFGGCTSLATAPVLPATTLADTCYYIMFYGCTSLNYVKCLATDISAYECTMYWVDGVAASGTFVKAALMSSDWECGENGIPLGWSVEDENGNPETNPCDDEIGFDAD